MGYYAYGMFKTVKKKTTDFFETLKKLSRNLKITILTQQVIVPVF